MEKACLDKARASAVRELTRLRNGADGVRPYWVSWTHLAAYGKFTLYVPRWYTSAVDDDGAVTVCAWIPAASKDEARRFVREAYDSDPGEGVEFRFIEERELDEPLEQKRGRGRFQWYTWMLWTDNMSELSQLPLDHAEDVVFYRFHTSTTDMDAVMKDRPYAVATDELGKYAYAFFKIGDTTILVKKRFYDLSKDEKNSVTFFTSNLDVNTDDILKAFDLRKEDLQ